MRSVQIQFWRICFVLALLLGMGLWQFDFVMTAVASNAPLNLTIFGTCLFGLVLLFAGMNTLRNEYRALYSLMEIDADLRHEATALADDPLWRHQRCAEIGIVFKKPLILGQSYQMLSDQLLREHRLLISASTMQTLIEGIDERLGDLKGLITYVSGILIFLGLIGTFLGLMITLASVGDILGGLDLSGGDPTETVSNLMKNLQTPLGGMATGFSSSLFGLVTSLTLSVMIQLMSQAGGSLKSDFSDWVSNAVQLHEGSEKFESVAVAGSASTQIEERRLALLMRTARHSISSSDRHRRELANLSAAVHALTNEARDSRASLNEVADAVRMLAEHNRVIHLAVSRSVDAFNKVADASNMRAEVAELTALMASQLEVRDERLTKVLRAMHRRIGELSAPVTIEGDALEKEGAELRSELRHHSDELNVRQINKLLAAIYRTDAPQNRAAKAEPTAPPTPLRAAAAKRAAAAGK